MRETTITTHNFQISRDEEGLRVNGEPVSVRIEQIKPEVWVLHHNDQQHWVYLPQLDTETGKLTGVIKGKRVEFELHSPVERLLSSMGMSSAAQQKLDVLKAPMPGLIHSIMVSPGQEVEQGEPLIILEAMKMENVIKASGEGTVAEIHVQEKASVEKNALLISFV